MVRRRDLTLSLLVFLVVFSIYARCPPSYPCGDSEWTIPTAMSILREGNTDLDEYRDIVRDERCNTLIVDSHIYNYFPIGTSLVILPVLFVSDQLCSHLFSFDLDQYIRTAQPSFVELYLACLLVALSAVFVYQIARFYVKPVSALFLVLIFAFCTSSWSTASRALWQHGPSMLMLSIAMYLILLAKTKPWIIQIVSIPLALSCIIRPTNMISLVFVSLFVFLEYKRYFLGYFLCAMLVFAPFFIHNSLIYHNAMPPYFRPQRIGNNPDFFRALWGNLASPSRGLFVFTPVFLFSIAAVIVKLRNGQFEKLDFFLLASILLHWVAISSFGHWWGGYSYGPRLFCDLIPYFVYFLISILAYMTRLPFAPRALVSLALLTLTAARSMSQT